MEEKKRSPLVELTLRQIEDQKVSSMDVCSELGGAEKESCRGYCGSMFDFMHREIW